MEYPVRRTETLSAAHAAHGLRPFNRPQAQIHLCLLTTRAWPACHTARRVKNLHHNISADCLKSLIIYMAVCGFSIYYSARLH